MRVSAWPCGCTCKARFAGNIENIAKKRNEARCARKAAPEGAYRRAKSPRRPFLTGPPASEQ